MGLFWLNCDQLQFEPAFFKSSWTQTQRHCLLKQSRRNQTNFESLCIFFFPVGYRSCWRWTRPYLRREGAPLISSSVEITTTVNRNNGKQMFYFSTVEFWCQWNILLYTLCSNISLLFWMSSPSGNDSIHKTFTIKNDYTGFKTAPKDQNISDLYNNFWFNLLKLS